MSMSAATAAPAPVTINGKKYRAAPVDFDGIGEMEEYARARILAIAAKAADDLPKELADKLIDRALKTATAIGFDSEEFRKYLMSGRGMITMLSLSLRGNHPGMTPKAVAEMVKDRDEELVSAVDVVLRISGFNGDEKDGQQPGEAVKGDAE
jgi:hypothetical protein